VKFSVGDLVTERKSNLWYLTQETSYEYYPHIPHSMSEYWVDYANKRRTEKLSIGIVMAVKENEPNSYYMERYYTYEVLWTSVSESASNSVMNRQFLEDELRLLSKINKDVLRHGNRDDGNI